MHSALSRHPPRRRGDWTDLPLVGRDDDLRWLLETSGDRILIASSGLGKTYLLEWLATREQKGLFIATRSRDDLAAALLDQSPTLLFLDDNGFETDWLEEILSLRRSVSHFDLVVTGWPNAEPILRSVLGQSADVRRLEGLRRKDILEILGYLGIRDEVWLGEIADQAANRPGLAVTLAQLAKSESWRDVVDGKGTLRELRQPVDRLLGERGAEALQLLSILALGGRLGVERKKASETLALSDAEAARLLTNLEATGILIETSTGTQPLTLAIEPEILRFALIDRTFFEGADRLDYLHFAGRLEGLAPLEALLEVAHRGGRVPRKLLEDELTARTARLGPGRLQSSPFFLGLGTVSLWQRFASLGREESQFVLERYDRHRIADVAAALLQHLPEKTLEALLDQCSTDAGESGGLIVAQVVKSWLSSQSGGAPDSFQKRQILLDVLQIRAAERGTRDDTAYALLAISPQLSESRTAASRDAVELLSDNLLASDQWQSLEELLSQALHLLLRRDEPFPWNEIASSFHAYRWPKPSNETTRRRGLTLVQRAMEQLRERAKTSLAQRLAWIRLVSYLQLDSAQVAEMRHGFEDSLAEAEILFPDLEASSLELPSDWLERWASEDPARVLGRWRNFVPEAKIVLPNLFPNLHSVALGLAARVQKPQPWVELFVELGAPETSLRPLLARLDQSTFARKAANLLEIDDFRWSAALEVARRGAPASLVPRALAELEGDLSRFRGEVRFTASLASDLAARHLDAESRLSWLLASSLATNPHFLGGELQRRAQQILLRRPAISQLPSGVWASFLSDLGRHPDFAASWLVSLSNSPTGEMLWPIVHYELTYLIATRLKKTNRARIIQEAALSWVERFSVPLVASDAPVTVSDADLFELLIQRRPSPAALQLPLQGFRPGPDWVPFAEKALAAGLSATTIARETILHGAWGGSPEEIQSWIEELKRIEAQRPQLLALTREALHLAKGRLVEAQAQRRQAEMKGLAAGG